MCPRCGNATTADDRFCWFCGLNLTVKNINNFNTKPSQRENDVKYDLGVMYFEKGDFTAAAQIFEELLKAEPDNLQIMSMLDRAQDMLKKQT